MDLADLWSYAQLIFTTIGIIAIFHRFLFPDRNGVTEITTFQSSPEDEATSIQQVESMYKKILATDDGPGKKLQCSDYSVGIITALPNEMKAAISVLDEEHAPPSDFCKPAGDYNHYVWGSMSTQSEAAHNVVIASFPAKRPGTVTAADVARLMVTTFPSIRLGLMVGIGGGVPSPNDIRLGDVVVSQGSGTTAGVVQYDFGKEEEEGFRRQGQMDSPPAALLSAITAFEARDPASSLIGAVTRASLKIQETYLNLENGPAYAYQGARNDRLFQSRYHGPGAAQWPIVSSLFRLQRSQPTHKDCASCDPRMLVERKSRTLPHVPRIHYGLIASGNRVIKSARMRDQIVASLKQDTNSGDCLCFEMEAAGLMNNFPCLVIRGVSDYADAHKNDVWHNYAALTAAAYARELLRVLSTAKVSSSKPAREIIGQIQRDVKSMRAELQKISDKQIQDWLESSEQQSYLDQAQVEIGRYQTESTWLFQHGDYRDWSSHNIHHIWLHGQSGCGKTVLASTVVKRLSAEGKMCLYFFFDFRDTNKQSLQSVLRSLIWQLFSLSDSEDVKTLVRQLYEDQKSPTPTIKKLKDTFDKMVEEADEVQVVLDALDESTRKGTDRDELLRWLKPRTQYDGPGVCKLRTIITSRSDQQDIVNILGSRCPGRAEICVDNESTSVKANIHQYIHKRLSNDGGFSEWRNKPSKSGVCEIESQGQGYMEQWHPIMKEMENRLVDKAGFMFRWASLTIDSLGEMGTIQKIKEALESLPNGLDEIYTRSLDEIKHHKSDAFRILQFLLFSPSQLKDEVLLDTTSINLETPTGYEIDPMRRMNSFDKLSSLMSTFIRRNEITGVLEIAHSSVRDYLLYTGPGNPPRYRFREVPAKATVVGVCLGYMDSILTQVTPSDPKDSHGSFLECAEYIWSTLACEEEHRNQTRTKPLAHAAAFRHDPSLQEGSVQNEAYSFILKFLIHNGSKLQHATSFHLGRRYGGPPLYVASAIGLTRIVGKLLSVGVKADENEGVDGFAEAVALPNSFYKNTLDRFGVKEHEEIKYGQNTDLGYGNALTAACYYGHESIVQMLLENDAAITGDERSWDRSPLSAACKPKGLNIVKLLLDKGADVNVGNSFSAACYTGNPEIMKLLLDKGAKSNDGHLLLNACRSLRPRASEIVNLLLDNGADPNVGDLLAVACRDGTPEIVKVLVDKGADVNAGNPLFIACRSGSLELVKLLLGKGANVNACEGYRGTPLSEACLNGRESIISVLLANGADVNASGGDYEHPLQAVCALHREPEVMVKMLIEHGADVNAKGGTYGTALQAAVAKSHERSIKLLLHAGADVHIKAGQHRTILEAAYFSQSQEAFQLLLDAGADLNGPSPGRGSILRLAASKKWFHVVRYVLEAGADLEDLHGLADRHQEYVFRVARESCNEVILERLGIRKSLEGSIRHED